MERLTCCWSITNVKPTNLPQGVPGAAMPIVAGVVGEMALPVTYRTLVTAVGQALAEATGYAIWSWVAWAARRSVGSSVGNSARRSTYQLVWRIVWGTDWWAAARSPRPSVG